VTLSHLEMRLKGCDGLSQPLVVRMRIGMAEELIDFASCIPSDPGSSGTPLQAVQPSKHYLVHAISRAFNQPCMGAFDG
jgi:hypothetical protein